MWKAVRITVLLLVLLIVAGQAVMDRLSATRWKRTVYVGAFPISADNSPVTRAYLARLDAGAIAEVSAFVNAEAKRYGVAIDQPIALERYPTPAKAPPALERDAGILTRIFWSLKLRYYRSRVMADISPRPKIALFLMYHDPSLTRTLPHSVGLQRGLSAVVHVFASPSQEDQNQIVIAHELLHTFGAKDAYDPATGLPLFPQGFAEPELSPLYPQHRAEIMAGRMALSATEARLPDSLEEEQVGPATARQIGWGGREP